MAKEIFCCYPLQEAENTFMQSGVSLLKKLFFSLSTAEFDAYSDKRQFSRRLYCSGRSSFDGNRDGLCLLSEC
jgi:hypothetical protein